MITLQETYLFLKNYSSYDLRQKILKEITDENRREPSGLPGSNPNCWRSNYVYKCNDEVLKAIKFILLEWQNKFVKKEDTPKYNITYWTNVNITGGANILHTHYRADADLSGVFYVKADGQGDIRFTTHEQLYRMINPHMPFSETISHKPEDGDLLLFPSYLLHEVEPNTSISPRVTIGFNIDVSY